MTVRGMTLALAEDRRRNIARNTRDGLDAAAKVAGGRRWSTPTSGSGDRNWAAVVGCAVSALQTCCVPGVILGE